MRLQRLQDADVSVNGQSLAFLIASNGTDIPVCGCDAWREDSHRHYHKVVALLYMAVDAANNRPFHVFRYPLLSSDPSLVSTICMTLRSLLGDGMSLCMLSESILYGCYFSTNLRASVAKLVLAICA